MSSFKDTFTKNEKGEGNLDYDDTAFYYFFCCILLVIILPIFLSIINPFFSKKSEKFSKCCPCQKCQSNANKIYQSEKYTWINKFYFLRVIINLSLIFFKIFFAILLMIYL